MTVPTLAERKKPGLSKTLTYERRPDRCQGCGATEDLRFWRECDEWDQPTVVLVVLCDSCTERLIVPHPRLYQQAEAWAPLPGAMSLCIECIHRDGLECSHTDLRANGGPGLEITFPQPIQAHVCCGGGRGGWKQIYQGPPSKCAGREIKRGKQHDRV